MSATTGPSGSWLFLIMQTLGTAVKAASKEPTVLVTMLAACVLCYDLDGGDAFASFLHMILSECCRLYEFDAGSRTWHTDLAVVLHITEKLSPQETIIAVMGATAYVGFWSCLRSLVVHGVTSRERKIYLILITLQCIAALELWSELQTQIENHEDAELQRRLDFLMSPRTRGDIAATGAGCDGLGKMLQVASTMALQLPIAALTVLVLHLMDSEICATVLAIPIALMWMSKDAQLEKQVRESPARRGKRVRFLVEPML
ncbi:hypothetical protein EXIGLDRAFT_727107, partial [Exidia glandulosa HHB12029]